MKSTGPLIACVLLLASAAPPPQDTAPSRTTAVSQGTSMAAAVSPDGRRIVIDLQGALWTLPAAGGRATRITDLTYDARQPAWSPDGSRIAFQAYRNGTWDIWTIEPDGSKPTPVTSGPFDDREPHWSPDGTRLAFSSDRSGNYDIWMLEIATGETRRVTSDDGNEYWPAWSPDGREIAFVAARENGRGICAVTLDGVERSLVPSTDTLGAPAWTPDGRAVVFSALSAGATRLMAGDRQISSDEDVFPFRAQWLSGSTLIYTADGLIKSRDVVSGADARPIRFQAELMAARASYTPRRHEFDDTAPRRALGIIRPGVSPDGERIVFSALGDVWTARRGEKPARLTDDASDDVDPVWSPDGKRVAYASDRHGSFDIFVRDLATGEDRRLTTSSAAEMRPTWSPDGSELAYVTTGGLVSGELSVVNVKTGAVRPVLDGRVGPISPGWSPDGRTIYVSALRTYSSRFREGVNQVLAVPADGSGTAAPRPVTLVPDVSSGKRGEGPAWSPDGRFVATVIDGEVHVIPLGPTGEPAGPPRALGTAAADQLSWTADSTHVVFSENDRVKLAPVDGGAAREWPIDLTYVRAIPSGTFVVHAGRLIDGVTADARSNVDIVVARNRIARVAPHADANHVGRVVDASKLTVLPGLIEAHGHYGSEFGGRFGRAHLAYGVTSVRSPAGHPYASLAEREAVESGRRPGPRLFATGYVVDGNRIYYPISAPMMSEAGVDRELERARLLEFDLLKTYVRLPDALQRRVIEGAHRIGIPVSSHEVHPASAFGIDSVEHLSATSRRGYSPKVSLLGRAYEDVIGLVAHAGMTITPTLVLGRARGMIGEAAALRAEPRWQILPEWVREAFDTPGSGPPGAASTQTLDTLAAYHRAGVPILAGTDSPIVPYGIALHMELELYVRAGLTPFEALQAATINVAKALHAGADLGTIAPGKLADLTIVEGNPLADIRATRNVRMVVVGGVVHGVDDLARQAAAGR